MIRPFLVRVVLLGTPLLVRADTINRPRHQTVPALHAIAGRKSLGCQPAIHCHAGVGCTSRHLLLVFTHTEVDQREMTKLSRTTTGAPGWSAPVFLQTLQSQLGTTFTLLSCTACLVSLLPVFGIGALLCDPLW
jgi:hypothetical protein